MRIKNTLGQIAMLAVACLISVPAVRADGINLIQNGTFTADGPGGIYGVPTGWSDFSHGLISGYYAEFSNEVNGSYNNYDGGYAFTNNSGYGAGNALPQLGQTFTDQKGESYTVSLDVMKSSYWWDSPGSAYAAEIDGQSLLTLTDLNGMGWTNFTFSFIGTGDDSFSFGGTSNNGGWGTTDISITGNGSTSVVPEPSSVSLMGLGLLGLMAGAFFMRRKNNAPSILPSTLSF